MFRFTVCHKSSLGFPHQFWHVAFVHSYKKNIVLVIGGLLLVRLLGLLVSPLGLHGDEAQYWDWSKNLDWGYFTKPPMIAWVIAATTSVFGDAEWAIRLSSPILHSITAYVIFCTGRVLYDGRSGFWAAIIYLLMPALWLSSGIVSTDVPLLLSWAVALNAWAHIRQQITWSRAIQLGLSVGLGILSKYAMLFFLPALAIAFIFDGATRKNLHSFKGYIAGFITLLIATPNIFWNINHDFATLTHTAANARIGVGSLFNPEEVFTFWLDQLGVFGPVIFILLCLTVIAALRSKLGEPSKWLSLFVLSPLLIISLEALLSRANANWAVSAYIAAPLLTAHYVLKYWNTLKIWLLAGLGFQTVISAVFTGIMLSPSLTDKTGMANSVKHLRAWPTTVAELEEILKSGHKGDMFQSVATDKRIIFYSLNYYGLNDTTPLKMWRKNTHPEHQADLQYPLKATDGPVLIINYYSPDVKPGQQDYAQYFREDFARLEKLPPIDIDLGGGKRRKFTLWVGYNYTPTQSR